MYLLLVSGSFNYHKTWISAVITDALSGKIIPTDRILLASNAPRMSSERFLTGMGYQMLMSYTIDKLPINRKRTEPLCVFLTLEVVGKVLGYGTRTEIQDFGRDTVKNSKTFLGPNKVKKSTDMKSKPAISKLEFRMERRINKTFVLLGLAITFLALLLEYFSSVKQFQEDYLAKQILF